MSDAAASTTMSNFLVLSAPFPQPNQALGNLYFYTHLYHHAIGFLPGPNFLGVEASMKPLASDRIREFKGLVNRMAICSNTYHQVTE